MNTLNTFLSETLPLILTRSSTSVLSLVVGGLVLSGMVFPIGLL